MFNKMFLLSSRLLRFRTGFVWHRSFQRATRTVLPRAVLGKMSGAGMLLAVAFGSTATQIKSLKARKPDGQSITEVIQAADRLYDSNKMKEALAYLERHSESKDAEVLWRLARLCYKVGKYHSEDLTQAQDMAEKAVSYGERALKADGQNFACHKWMGIIISWSSEFQGTRRKIERSFDVRDHFERAIELNPQDPTSRHLLGQWCYSVASVPWYQKKIAAVVFATPPYATYAEALDHFQDAEKLEPGFYSTNWLFIGKCYLQLGQVTEGGAWLKKAAAYSSEVPEDLEAKDEAEQLLKKLAIK